MCYKKTLKFQDYNNCLKAARKERTINYLEKKIRINVDSLKGDQKSMMFSLKSLITLLSVQMMIKECNQLI